jgi:hypothetical protein
VSTYCSHSEFRRLVLYLYLYLSFFTHISLFPLLVGNVLVAVDVYGVVLDVLESVSSFLQALGKPVPIYFLSPASEFLLAYTNIVGEWYELSPGKKG